MCVTQHMQVGNDLAGCRRELMAGSPDQSGPTNYNVSLMRTPLEPQLTRDACDGYMP